MNILGIDFEDWFHPQLIQKFLTNEKKEPKVINGIDKILEFLSKNNTYATFFMVGELLEKKPALLDKILEHGHEIAFHTMNHSRIDSQGFKEKFEDEIKTFARLTEKKSKGFRAPTFSLNQTSAWIIDMLLENGYLYDSSIVPAKTNMYGLANAETKPYFISSDNIEKNNPDAKLIEFPLLVTKFFGKKIPAGGGFYLRTLPQRIIKNAIKNYEKKCIPATFYVHSWELTPEFMPKISLPQKDKFVTYHNISKTMTRLGEILKEFEFTSFNRYLQKNKIN